MQHLYAKQMRWLDSNEPINLFSSHEQLLREDVWAAMTGAVAGGSLAALAGACQAALLLYVYLGRHLLLQLEAFLGRMLLRLAEGRPPGGAARQEAALEARDSCMCLG